MFVFVLKVYLFYNTRVDSGQMWRKISAHIFVTLSEQMKVADPDTGSRFSQSLARSITGNWCALCTLFLCLAISTLCFATSSLGAPGFLKTTKMSILRKLLQLVLFIGNNRKEIGRSIGHLNLID